jgi:hypothetical protein
MYTVLDVLLFPLGVFVEAFVGIMCPVESEGMRRNRRWALISLVGCLGVFGLVCLLAAIIPGHPGIAPLIVVGLVFMFTFLIAGKACADEAENRKKRDGF